MPVTWVMWGAVGASRGSVGLKAIFVDCCADVCCPYASKWTAYILLEGAAGLCAMIRGISPNLPFIELGDVGCVDRGGGLPCVGVIHKSIHSFGCAWVCMLVIPYFMGGVIQYESHES